MEWLVLILTIAVVLYLVVGLVVLFRRLRQRGLAAPTSPGGGPGDPFPFLVVAALWPLYLRQAEKPAR